MGCRGKPSAATLLLLSLLFTSTDPIYSVSPFEKWTQLGIDRLEDAVLVNVAVQSNANLDIGHNTNTRFEEHDEADCFTAVLDSAPNIGDYFVPREVLPELLCPTPLIFTPAVLAMVYCICKKRLKHHD